MKQSKMKHIQQIFLIFLILFFHFIPISQGQDVHVTIPDTTSETGTTINIPIRCDDVTNKWIYSYGFKIGYNNTVIQATSLEISGTITETWGTPTYNIMDGEITVALAGSSPLSGSGVLIFISFYVVGTSGSSSTLHISEFIFNEGNPLANTSDGSCTVNNGSGIYSNELKPSSFQLYPAYPNPFNPSTIIEFDIPAKNHVCIKIFDILGRPVYELLNHTLDAGHYTLNWNGKTFNEIDIGSGTYFVKISFEHKNLIRKVIKIK